MTRYKVKHKNIFPSNIKKEYTYKFHCFLGVSINNPLFLGKGLPALLTWVSAKYPYCIILISDYLDRFNQKIFCEEAILNRAIDSSLETGNRIERSIQSCITKLQIENIIVERWLKYYDLREVQIIKKQLYSQLEKKNEFYASVNQSAIEYLKKKSNLSRLLCNERNIGLSIDYIIEELAVFSYLIQIGARVQLYPGTQLPILKRIADKAIILNDTNLDQGIYVELTVKK